ncbi:MAG TPA: hypothetical protein PKJ05_05170 [Bacillota bacterium]|nr:hypothetical protein [Bacillota bacterium]
MRKIALVATMIILIMSFAAASSIAAPENSLSVNGGYSHTWIELEYEMKTDPFAYGAKLGLGYYAFEVGGFFRYYYGLNSLLNIPAEYRLSVFGGITPSFLLGTWYYDGVGFGLKIGPGVDFRWKQLRVYIEGGYRFDTLGGIHHGGYSTAGIGYIF